LQKKIISFIMSVRPFAWNSWARTGRILMKFGIIRTSVYKIKVPLKCDKNNGYFTWRCIHVYDNISLNSSSSEKCFKVVDKIKTHFMFDNLFSYKIVPFMRRYGKILWSQGDGNIIRRMRFACWASKATRACASTHTQADICKTYCFSAATVISWTHFSAAIYAHCLSFVILQNAGRWTKSKVRKMPTWQRDLQNAVWLYSDSYKGCSYRFCGPQVSSRGSA
jgi:hypothetical protein